MSACTCDVCKYGAEFQEHLARVPEDDRAFWETMYDGLCALSLDLDVANAKLEGAWPGWSTQQSVDLLTLTTEGLVMQPVEKNRES